MRFEASGAIPARASGTILACAFFLALVGVSRAGEDGIFDAAMTRASANLRGAEFYLRKKNPTMGGFELDAFESEWRYVTGRFRGEAPSAYAADPKWRVTLDAVSGRLELARGAISNGEFAAARRLVTGVRAALAELRRRNGVTVFEDCVEEMRTTFAGLYVYRRKPPDFSSSEQMTRVKTAAAAAEDRFRRCYDRAPSAYRGDDMFERMFKESLADFGKLAVAMEEGNTQDFVDRLRRIVSYLDLIFVRFG